MGLRTQFGSASGVLLAFSRVALLVPLLALLASAQSQPTEYEVKAAYLYNFAKFIKWPDSGAPADSFNICVMGQDPFNGALQSIVSGEKISGKPAAVKHVDSLHDAADCKMLFISQSEARRARSILEDVASAPVLTVSDIPNFLDHGGMIQFVMQSGRVRFDINLDAAHAARLNLSSELLKVAEYVKGHP